MIGYHIASRIVLIGLAYVVLRQFILPQVQANVVNPLETVAKALQNK